jgi:selenium-dependent xanthine dehydrogenase
MIGRHNETDESSLQMKPNIRSGESAAGELESSGPGAMETFSFRLNGEDRQVLAWPDEPLLEVLRDKCGIKSVKAGCGPQRECGCCLALIDGSPKVTCSVRIAQAANHAILTLEGVSDNERRLYADAFQAAAGLQCGFCTPGLVLRIKWMTDQGRTLSRPEIARVLDGHLCRCTGYVKIIDAVELIQTAKQGGALPEVIDNGGVGKCLRRYQGDALALGTRPFIADIDVPDMLYGAVLLSPHARARVIRIDTTRALAVPGVAVVATARDVPGDRWVGQIIADWPCFVAEGEEVRCVGDVVAAVAAKSMRIAREAAQFVEVQYEVLAPMLDPAEAIKPGVPQVNPKHDNVLSVTQYARGDVDAALAASAHVVNGTWATQRIEHLFLEPEAALAVPLPDGRLHFYSQSQGIFDDRRQVAGVLGEPEARLFCELVPNGGGFGGKEDMTIQAQTALLARMTGRPVRVVLNREESIRMHPKRHPLTMTYTVGCDADGRLTAARINILGDSGAYASVGGKVLERAAGHACGPYRMPVLAIEAVAAYTNNPPCGAMRGFGVNQTSFAIEGCLDLLAAKAGIDRWEMRWRNALHVGDMFSTGQILEKSVGIAQTLLAVKPAYDAARAQGRAVGIACGLKNSGIGNGAIEYGKCRLVVQPDGTIDLHTGFTEMGQGLLTILTQCAVEVTGLPASIFRPQVNSRFEIGTGHTTGSRATLLAGPAVIDAAWKLKADLNCGLTLTGLAGRVYAGEYCIDDTTAPGETKHGKIKTHTTFGFATQVVVLSERGTVERVIAAHDVGRALNPQQCEAQIQGAVHMGLGYALTEELPCKDGMPVTFKLREIGVLRAQHMPEVEVILVEDPEPEGPFGAKGVGEIGLVPTAGAVAGALQAFDGVRRMRLPMKDSPAARAINLGRIPDGEKDQWH